MEINCLVCGGTNQVDTKLDALADKWVDKGKSGWICNKCVDNYNEEFYNKINFDGENVYEYS